MHNHQSWPDITLNSFYYSLDVILEMSYTFMAQRTWNSSVKKSIGKKKKKVNKR